MRTVWSRSVIFVLLVLSPFVMGSATPYFEKPSVDAWKMLPEVVITAKKIKRKHHYCTTEFLGFKIRGRVNTKISSQLMQALEDYSGPSIGINSLRRFWRKRSKHYTGNAVDLEFKHELIEWLVSEQGIT
ncbi:MAG: hypothetical protein KDD45_14675 [Bdellovibrionales bacterium]|nr:hypothetical protein [Bdellovibrionales bacterium]